MIMLKRVFLYLVLLLTLPLQASDSLSLEIVRRLDNLMADSLLRHSQLGLYVYDLTDDTTLYFLLVKHKRSALNNINSANMRNTIRTDSSGNSKLPLPDI